MGRLANIKSIDQNLPPGNQGFKLGETSSGCDLGDINTDWLPRCVCGISVGFKAGEINCVKPVAGGGMGDIMDPPGVSGTWRGVLGARIPDPTEPLA